MEPNPTHKHPTQTTSEPSTGIHSVPGDEPLSAALDVIYEWKSVWLRAMAEAWRDPAFAAALTDPNDPEAAEKAFEKLGFDGKVRYLDDAGRLRAFDLYRLLHIRVVRNEDATYREPDRTSEYRNGWRAAVEHQELRMELTLQLPKAPLEEYQALAVADYQAAGKVYPFTCT